MVCSLVCLDWAKQCRPRLWKDSTITIKSDEDLIALNTHTLHSPRLVPLATLVEKVELKPTLGARSWCHHFAISPFYRASNQRLDTVLRINGPFPDMLPCAALRSLTWDLPRSLRVPCFAFSVVFLQNLHFPRLSDFHALLGGLTHCRIFYIYRVTWDTTDMSPISVPAANLDQVVCASSPHFEKDAKSRYIWISVERCTDNAAMAALAYRRLEAPSQSLFSHMDIAGQKAVLTLFAVLMRLRYDKSLSRGISKCHHFDNVTLSLLMTG